MVNMQEVRSYQERTAAAESIILDLVQVARSSREVAFKNIQKATAAGVLHDWIETTERQCDAPRSYSADRDRLVSLINTAMLDA
ncbi:hypothetical protein [Burkholderia cenocepacia]|uniref:hypothetical protein n=1 Tax=Burkholderia cenocepacia TaxID=95486 RepID=UPI0019073C0C|nr:hypothetical protein [Burkholderia cenocepacia]MBJ9696941.1 hypothetical protein [Burkholderia cenocepacia]